MRGQGYVTPNHWALHANVSKMVNANECIQESRAIAGRTARCRCKFRYVGLSNFQRHRAVSLPQHGFLEYTSATVQNGEITHKTLIFTPGT